MILEKISKAIRFSHQEHMIFSLVDMPWKIDSLLRHFDRKLTTPVQLSTIILVMDKHKNILTNDIRGACLVAAQEPHKGIMTC